MRRSYKELDGRYRQPSQAEIFEDLANAMEDGIKSELENVRMMFEAVEKDIQDTKDEKDRRQLIKCKNTILRIREMVLKDKPVAERNAVLLRAAVEAMK